jgi:hypothetical protein
MAAVVAAYEGSFGAAQAERLLWRAGFGPRKGEAEALAAIIELRNLGEDAHDLRMRRVGGTGIYVWPLAQPGDTVDREFKLVPGTYRLTCAVANHAELGMVATLHVR